MTAPELLARHNSRCKLCRRRIRRGEDYVSRIPGGFWVHALCAAKLRRIREDEAAV